MIIGGPRWLVHGSSPLVSSGELAEVLNYFTTNSINPLSRMIKQEAPKPENVPNPTSNVKTESSVLENEILGDIFAESFLRKDSSIGKTESKKLSVVFINRISKWGQHRILGNFKDIDLKLREDSFLAENVEYQSVVFEELSFFEQWKLAYFTDIFVGPHGHFLTWCIFSKNPNSACIELLPFLSGPAPVCPICLNQWGTESHGTFPDIFNLGKRYHKCVQGSRTSTNYTSTGANCLYWRKTAVFNVESEKVVQSIKEAVLLIRNTS